MNINGIFPAVLTPFTANGSVHLDRYAAHVERLYAAGVNGIYAGGNAGEWYSMSLEERKELTSVTVQVSRGRGLVLVHVGALRIEESVELARHAEQAGASAISSLPPYIQPWTLPEVRGWFDRLSNATELPFFVYYFPRLTGLVSGEPFFKALRTLPRIAGYKFTDANLFDLGLVLQGPYTVLNGHDPNLSAALRMGAQGGIGSFYNVVPELVVTLYRASIAGDVACAERAQARINRVIQVVRGYRLIPALKFLSGLQGFDQGTMREPALALSIEEQKRLEEQMERVLCEP